jgi:LacI family transcriptional regulator
MSISRVAKLAGVSTATVSRVMNRRALVADETVQKVQHAMKRAGYRPAPPAERRGPKAKLHLPLRHNTIAFFWTAGRQPAQTLTGAGLLEGASAALRKHRINLAVDYFNAPDDLPPVVAAERLDGLLLHGPEPDAAIVSKLRRFPVVWLLSPGSRVWGDRVQPDHRQVARLALELMLERRARQLCVMTYRPRLPGQDFYSERADAFAQAARLHGVPCVELGGDVDPPPDDAGRFKAAESMVATFTKLSPRPDAIFVANELGSYVHEHLRQRGLRPMRDVLLIAGDKEHCPQHLDPVPVKVEVHSQSIGQLAAELLLWRLTNPTAPFVTQLVQPQLVVPEP